MARDCPNGRIYGRGYGMGNQNRNNRCFNCGKEGHWTKECPEERSFLRCYTCGKEGHKSDACPTQLEQRERFGGYDGYNNYNGYGGNMNNKK